MHTTTLLLLCKAAATTLPELSLAFIFLGMPSGCAIHLTHVAGFTVNRPVLLDNSLDGSLPSHKCSRASAAPRISVQSAVHWRGTQGNAKGQQAFLYHYICLVATIEARALEHRHTRGLPCCLQPFARIMSPRN